MPALELSQEHEVRVKVPTGTHVLMTTVKHGIVPCCCVPDRRKEGKSPEWDTDRNKLIKNKLDIDLIHSLLYSKHFQMDRRSYCW